METAAALPSARSKAPAAFWLRERPYRLLFPLGALLAWFGIFHWLLLATKVDPSYRPIFHAMTQIEGFCACFAAGFLLTFVPRRTQSAPPAVGTVLLVAICPVLTSLLAWYELWAASQFPWMVFLVALALFVFRRVGWARISRMPSSFVWVFAALFVGFFGSLFTGIAAATHHMWMHDIGRGMVLQGVMSALVLGMSGFLLPVISRGEAPVGGDRSGRLWHLAAVVAFFAGFWVEPFHHALGMGLRALVAALVLGIGARAYRLPNRPGAHRWLVWLGVWMLPAGFALAALEPAWRVAALHVAFIGSFGLMIFAVSLQVALSHGNRGGPLTRWPWQVVGMAGLLLAAVIFRVLLGANLAHFYLWMGLAAGCFLAATVLWGWLVVPAIVAPPRVDMLIRLSEFTQSSE